MKKLTKVKSKKFKTKAEASKWAAKEKKKVSGEAKWETNRLDSDLMKWEAVIFRKV